MGKRKTHYTCSHSHTNTHTHTHTHRIMGSSLSLKGRMDNRELNYGDWRTGWYKRSTERAGEEEWRGFNKASVKWTRKAGAQYICHQTVKTNKEGRRTGTTAQYGLTRSALAASGEKTQLYTPTDEPLALSLSLSPSRSGLWGRYRV